MSVDLKECYVCGKKMSVDSEKCTVEEKNIRYFCSDNCFWLYTVKGEHPDNTGAIIYPQKDSNQKRWEILDIR